MDQKQKELETSVKAYKEMEAELATIQDSLSSIKAPERPVSVQALSELQDYDLERKRVEESKRMLEDRRIKVHQQLGVLKDEITHLIPVKNVWVKVNEWAVSYYYDVWGGGHHEIEIRQWGENLPEQVDRTYYA